MLTKYLDPKNDIAFKKIFGSEKHKNSDEIIKEAYEVLNQYNWDEKELLAYEQETKRIWDNKAVEEGKLDVAKAKGVEKGRVDGIVEGEKLKALEIAKKLLQSGMQVESISAITGLTENEIIDLK